MKRYARIEFVTAEQWSDCHKPPDCVREFMQETVEYSLVETTQALYVVHTGVNKVEQQIRCGDWILHLNDGSLEVLTDTMFRSMFVDADKASILLEESSA